MSAIRTCGTCHPPAEDSPEREQIDRFATFLRILNEVPVGEDGMRHIGPRAFAYANGADVDPMGCTGLTALWCPRHGDCVCPREEDGHHEALDATDCPLHSPAGDHPWPDEAELPTGAP